VRLVAIRRVDDLEIDQDLTFVRRSWAVQRVGWVGIGIVLAVALAGGFGSGPLSRQRAVVPGLLEVDYPRFVRYEAPQTLTVRLAGPALGGPEARVWIDRRYLDDARIESVTPPPLRVETGTDRLVYVFSLLGGAEPVTISIVLQPQHIGATAGRIGVAGDERFVPIRQFAYP
jgi:hypothetical protein